jgi:radical SAM protein with 4Fe4S-binding SPASM domain
MTVRSSRRVTYLNNDILYKWESVPDLKYDNWLRMLSPQVGEDFSVDGFPFFVQIEPTNFCNLKCPVCPAGGFGFKRDRRHMKLNEFKSIIDDMEKYLLFIVLWDWGEPLMNPDLPEMIRYAAERDMKTVVSTNCNCNSFHDADYMGRLLRSGLTTLIFAIDSVHQKQYELYRKKGDLNKALEGIKNNIALKKQFGGGPTLVMRMVLMKQNEHEIHKLRGLARKLGVDRFSVKTMNPLYMSESSDCEIVPVNTDFRRFEYKKGTYERIKIDFHCNIIYRQCTVHSNGDVAPCCWWYDNDHASVNCFRDGGLQQIWNSPAYNNLRAQVASDKDAIHYCRTCCLNYKLSRTGWFYQTLDLTTSRLEQSKYQLKRHIELTMNKKLLNSMIQTRDAVKRLFRGKDPSTHA